MSKKTNLQAPWITLYNKIRAMFEQDEDITVEPIAQISDGVYDICLSSAHSVKLNAIEKILKNKFEMGNITVNVKFKYENENDDMISLHDFEVAFAGNAIFSQAKALDNPWEYNASYVIFSKDVVQFYNDDLTDIYGNFNGLAEDIAREIFKETELPIYYCTESY